MTRKAEYHFDGLNPLQWAKLMALGALWVALFMIASQLAVWEGIVLITMISIFTAMVWRQIMTSIRSGCWLTDSHFHVYLDQKQWSFPLSGIAGFKGRRNAFSMRPPQLELISGRQVTLPITAIPPAAQLARWFADSAIHVESLSKR
ncbi:MAG: hypothetical protein JXR13_18405 [Thalassovita sp.]